MNKTNSKLESLIKDFKHTTLSGYPNNKVGVTLLDEEPGVTGIYIRDKDGGLYPARTVHRKNPVYHKSVCDSWLTHPGINEDKRSGI